MSKSHIFIFLSFLLTSFSSLAEGEILNKLIIKATTSSQGTVLVGGQPKYEKTFNVTVLSKAKEPIELTGFVGCYKAFDDKGKEFDELDVQAELLGTLGKNAKEGEVSFISDDNSVYNAKFVKWSSQCPHLANRMK